MTALAVEALIDGALEFVSTSTDRGEKVLIGDNFQERPMHSGRAIWDLLVPDSPIRLRREIVQELTVWLAHAERYADAAEWPAGFDDTTVAVCGGPPSVNEDISWAHYSCRAGVPTGCMTLGHSRVAPTITVTGSIEVHFAGDEPGRKLFWRSAILLEGDDLASLIRNAPHAYPALFFVDGVLHQATKLAGGYLGSRARVREALANLDDWGHWVFTCPPPTLTPDENVPLNAVGQPGNQIIEKRFGGLGLDAAPESPDVYARKHPREARETVIGERTLYCEWHIKLERHRNRIHFHSPIPESGDRVVVGMIHEHLPLL